MVASQNAVATTRRRVLLALAGSLALHAILLVGLNLRPLPDVVFGDVLRQFPLTVLLDPLTPLAVAPKTLPAARRSESITSSPSRTSLRSDLPAPKAPATTAQIVQTPTQPRFDLELLRQQARESGQGKQTPIAPQNLGQALPQPALERDTPLSKSIAKAKRPDCKTAHSRWGLFAIPLLIYDTATESGCQW